VTDSYSSIRERYDYGRSLREQAPLESHSELSTDSSRDDPVWLIEAQNERRIPWLVPVRRARMSATAFTFYRGSAKIMAADLAQTPVSGLNCQVCGDAHLSNFGVYASPERRLVFDLNDFDETLPGPWEWDVKRLAASFILAGRNSGLKEQETQAAAEISTRVYRKTMAALSGMRLYDIWNSLVEMDQIRKSIDDQDIQKAVQMDMKKAKKKDSLHALDRLAEEVDGKYQIRSEPPLLIPLRDLPRDYGGENMEESILSSYEHYLSNLPDHIEHLLRKYRPTDFAVKVVGVGSVGTRCYILLLEGRDRSDPLLLQIKEANTSVLEAYLPVSQYQTCSKRVVEGQRMMQTVSDIFLGDSGVATDAESYYLRQLKDWKGSADVDKINGEELALLARARGLTLARSHARSGDPVAISAYLGSKKTFDRAVASFAQQYADLAAQDHAVFVAQIEEGKLEAAEYG
jgi:uncharacterized protein (DUF2252 family)